MPAVSTESYPESQALSVLPDYAIDYAPFIYMSQEEQYWQSKLEDFIKACTIENVDGTQVEFDEKTRGSIAQLADPRCTKTATYVSFKRHPVLGIDGAAMSVFDCKPNVETGRSEAPIWIIAVDKSKTIGEGVVDIFYFYFYAFNLGNAVLNKNYGNHLGDWEHNMIRFKDGVPQAMHYSQHAVGTAFTWDALEKLGKRPVVYCAAGSHANYPRQGFHNYANIPFGAGPHDRCSKGLPWDITLNYIATSYDPAKPESSRFAVISQAAVSAIPKQVPLPTEGSTTPTKTQGGLTHEDILAVLNFPGCFGNYWSSGQPVNDQPPKFQQKIRRGLFSVQPWKALVWSTGPTGPRDKGLNRTVSLPQLPTKTSIL